jgi:hypothetical protein
VEEPGLDLQYWETRWTELEEQFGADPAGALPDAADFVESMLGAYGHDPDEVRELGEPVSDMGEPTDLIEDYRAARDVADRVERGEELEQGDVLHAIANLREIYRTLSVAADA